MRPKWVFSLFQQDREVRIDAEAIQPIDVKVAKSCFSSGELRQLEGLPGSSWLRGFYRCWTCKEAILKGEGIGLTIPLNSFDVWFVQESELRLIDVRLPAQLHSPWYLFPLDFGPGLVVSLAINGRPSSLKLLDILDDRQGALPTYRHCVADLDVSVELPYASAAPMDSGDGFVLVKIRGFREFEGNFSNWKCEGKNVFAQCTIMQ
jgi:hypothetical protein